MREIGGYFELQRFKGREYHENALRFNAARYAIRYVVEAKGFRNIFVPIFLCSSVAETLRAGCANVVAYPITQDWLPALTAPLSDDDAVIVVNYFGQLDQKTIERMREGFHNVIVDNIQAFFQKPVAGVSTVYSCRKYFGVADGAYLYTDADQEGYHQLLPDYSTERAAFLTGRYERGAQAFYAAFRENEAMLDCAGPRKMSAYTQNLLRAVDYEWCIRKRRDNAAVLDHYLKRHNLIDVKDHAGLFMYPFLQDGCKDLRAQLIARNIYIPKLWPSLSIPVPPDSREAFLSEHIIWLPIDQRYGTDDMEYLAAAINKIMGWTS